MFSKCFLFSRLFWWTFRSSIADLNGRRVNIVVLPSLYYHFIHFLFQKLLYENVASVFFVVVFSNTFPWRYFQCVFVSIKQDMSTSYCPMLSHSSSNVWWPKDISKLLKFWKRSRVCLVSFELVMRSPNGKLLWRSSFVYKNESSSLDESDEYLGECLEIIGRDLRVVGVRLVPHIFAAFCDVVEEVVVVGESRGFRWVVFVVVVFFFGLWLVLNV